MSLESDVFTRKSPKFETLAPFGFEFDGEKYTYGEEIMGGEFRADISIDKSGTVTGKVTDTAADEEYLPLHIEARVGAFVGEVRKAYSKILERICAACFEDSEFSFPQSNRIARFIFEAYDEKPDYPFETLKEAAVFRYPNNRKWYALIMPVKRNSVTKEKSDDEEKIPVVDVMNVKAGEDLTPEALKTPGIYPAYHMNHKSWVSIILDGTVPDEKIMELINVSREFAINAGKSRKKIDK